MASERSGEIAAQPVATFGELMVRLAPSEHRLLEQSSSLEFSFGGAEANVAVSLTRLGAEARFITRLPDNAIAEAGRRALERHRVDTSHLVVGGERMGLYWVESGFAQRPSRVTYDRAGSSMASIRPGDISWEEALAGCGWLHVSGITPGLSESAAAVTKEAVSAARDAHVTVSVDLNYRAQLWAWTNDRAMVMAELVENADVVFSNEEDLSLVFGIGSPASDQDLERPQLERYEAAIAEFQRRFPGVREVGLSIRGSVSASDNYWSAVLQAPSGFFSSRSYRIAPILDRVGTGDAFAAGAIYGLRSAEADPQDVVDFAAAAACLKHSIEGDFNLVDAAAVRRLVAGDGTGRIIR